MHLWSIPFLKFLFYVNINFGKSPPFFDSTGKRRKTPTPWGKIQPKNPWKTPIYPLENPTPSRGGGGGADL